MGVRSFGVRDPLPGHGGDDSARCWRDATSGKMLVEQGDCARRVTPASTFKVAISLMDVIRGFWLMRAMGEARFARYVRAFGYGNEDVSGDTRRHDGLTQAWLSSSPRISPLEEVGVLRRLVRRELGVSALAYEMTAHITAVGLVGEGWMVHGKTGTGSPVLADGVRDEVHLYGWFVGWAEKGARRVVFARLMQDEGGESERSGARARFLREAPALLEELSRPND